MRSLTIRVLLLLFLIVLLNEYQASIIRYKRDDEYIRITVDTKYIGDDTLFVCNVVSPNKDVDVVWYKNNEVAKI